jgi:hypothetical protein
MQKILTILFLIISPFTLAQEPPKGQDNTAGNGFSRGGGSGGPDNFGYTYNDSSTGMCSNQFIDISGTGTSVVSGDDVGAPVTLAGSFDFYGNTVNELAVTSNGYLSTDNTDTGPDLSNDCPLPASPSTGGGARIYPLHDDLVASNGVFYEFFPVCPRPSDNFPGSSLGCHVFHWDEVAHFGDPTPFDIEVIIYELSYEIVMVHDDRNPELGNGSTTGIQNDGATDGLTYACNTASSIPASSAQCFVHPNPDSSLTAVPALPVPMNNKIMLVVLSLLLAMMAFAVIRRRQNV